MRLGLARRPAATRTLARMVGLAAAAGLALAAGCESRSSAPVQFLDRTAAAGIEFRHTDGSSGRYFITETISSGVGLFDYDGDGLLDIYFVNGRPLPPGAPPGAGAARATPRNALYHNGGVGPDGIPHFTDLTEKAGVPGTGFGVACCVGDYDGDGQLDLFITQLGPDVLYRNQGDGTFTDVTARAGVGDPSFGGCAAFGDIDRDGWLDLYVANYCFEDFEKSKPCLYSNNVKNYCTPSVFAGVPHSLFKNNGDGTFKDVSVSSGIRKVAPGKGLGVVFSDFDDDGYPEIYVANDGAAKYLFHNLHDGTLKDIALEAGVALDMNGDEQGSMGIDVADYDGDSRFDIVVTNYQKQNNVVYHNQGNLLFTDLGLKCGIAADSLPLVGWGTKFFDSNNDGVLDLFVANGHIEDRIEEYDPSSSYLQQNQLFQGIGNGMFKDISNQSGDGLKLKRSSRGTAAGDIDNDGDVDLVVSCSRDRPILLINQGGNQAGNWVQVQLTGRKPNLFAIGAKVTLRVGPRVWIDEVRSGGSYASQSDLRLHFGIGSARAVDKLEVRWPDGKTESIAGLVVNRLNRIVEGKGVIQNGAKVAALKEN